VNHWVIAPVLGPMLVALALLMAGRPALQRLIVATGIVLETALVLWLFWRSLNPGIETYLPGNLLPPDGTVLVLDKLAALLLLLVAVLGAGATLRFTLQGGARTAPQGLALMQLVVAGLNGAVLAGELASLWALWALALAATAALAPQHWQRMVAGALVLLVAVALMCHGNASGTLADLAERGAGSGIAGLALCAAFAFLIGTAPGQPPLLGCAVGLAATGLLARIATLMPVDHWLMPLALPVVALSIWRRSSLAQTGLCAIALTGFAQGTEAATVAGLWAFVAGFVAAQAAILGDRPLALVVQCLCALAAAGLMLLATDLWMVKAAMLVAAPALVLTTGYRVARCPPVRFQPLALCAVLALAAGFALHADRIGTQLAGIAAQLHQPGIYITAVMGLPAGAQP